jgi:hypothetical protein
VYEAQWRDSKAGGATPAAGDASEDAFNFVPGRPSLELAAVAPPASDLDIAAPELERSDVAIIPRPFRTADAGTTQAPR